MKNLRMLLAAIALLASISGYAVTGLNPYAYKLGTVTQSDSNRKMTFQYWLNAPATSVGISISYTQDDTQHVMNYTGTTNEGENNVTVSTAGLPANTPISWSVTVNKTSNIEPIQISQSYNFYCPQGVAVDKDPMSNNFGRILVTETLQGRTGTSTTNYVSSTSDKGGTIQAGLYAFDARFKQLNTKGVPYKGGKTFTQKMTHSSLDGGHQPYQVKISEDGRIFISCADIRSRGVVVWEAVDKDNLNTTWKAIIRNGEDGVWDKTNYQLYDANKKFYAGFNCSMDVKGRGSDLKILLYSTNYSGVHAFDPKGYRLDEYAIGTFSGNDFAGTIQNIWTPGATAYGIVYDNAQVIYDGEGGYWFGASRESGTQTNLAHVNRNGTQDQYETTKTLYGGSGIMLHTTTYEPNAGQRWMFKGLERESVSNGKFGIWNITTDANGTTSRDRIYTVTSTGLGRNHNDFAVDYAENLFVVGNHGEKIVAFALPYSGTKTTPARTTFTLAEVPASVTHTVSTTSTPNGYGTTMGDGVYHFGEEVTVTAVPTDTNLYEFEKWTTSTGYTHLDNPKTFTLSRDIVFTAHFKVKKFAVEYFNLFQNKQDITDYYKTYANASDKMDVKNNTRLWRLFQVEYNKRFYEKGHRYFDYGDIVTSRKLFYVLKFVNKDTTIASGSYAQTAKEASVMRANIENILDDSSSPMYWLGQYLEHAVGKEDIHEYSEKNAEGKTVYTNIWGFYLQAFMNHTQKFYTMDYKSSVSDGEKLAGDYKAVRFDEKGKPDYWRKWWQRIALGLEDTTTYKPVPTGWTEPARPVGWSIADKNYSTNKIIYNPCASWYKWNNDTAAINENKVLGWYYGEKDPTTWKDNPDEVDIVHYINRSGNLIAIWVPTEVHENKNNYDVTQLMTTQGTTHNVRVYRRMQAGMYNTICLPFPVATLAGTPYEGATVLRLASSELINPEIGDEDIEHNGVQLIFEEVGFTGEDDMMYAGFPYLIMPTSEINDWVTFNGIPKDSIYTGEGKTIATDYVSMHGHINPSDIEASSTTMILVANNRLAVVAESDEMQGLRAYFTLQGAAAAYDLGQQAKVNIPQKIPTELSEGIETAPENTTHKVLYNGRIYILRGDEVYDLMGNRVR